MACGLTPDLMRMLARATEEKEKLAAEATAELTLTADQLAARKDRAQQLQEQQALEGETDPQASAYDWTQSYERWAAWEDPEELAEAERAARDKHARATEAAARGGCNHDHSAEQRLMDQTTDEKLATCEAARQLGNAFFHQGQYQRAAYNYHRALVIFEYVFPETPEAEQRFDDLRRRTLLNYCACRLRTGHLEDARHHADLALELDPTSIKALYRRAQAARLLDDFDAARRDLTTARGLLEARKQEADAPEDDDNTDGALRLEWSLLQAKMLAYKARLRLVSTAMFGGGANPLRPKSDDAQDRSPPTHATMRLQLKPSTTMATGSDGERAQLRSPSAAAVAVVDSAIPCTDGFAELAAYLAGATTS